MLKTLSIKCVFDKQGEIASGGNTEDEAHSLAGHVKICLKYLDPANYFALLSTLLFSITDSIKLDYPH